MIKSTTYHMSQSVEGALRNWSFRDWSLAAESNDTTASDLKEEFWKLFREGVHYLPMGDCTNFHPKKGCRGHKHGLDIDISSTKLKREHQENMLKILASFNIRRARLANETGLNHHALNRFYEMKPISLRLAGKIGIYLAGLSAEQPRV